MQSVWNDPKRYNDHARHFACPVKRDSFGYALTQLMKGVDAIRVMESNGDNQDSKIHGNPIYYNRVQTNAANGINMASATRYQVDQQHSHHDQQCNVTGMESLHMVV